MCELIGLNHALLLKIRQGPQLHELHRRFKLMESFFEIRKWNLTTLTSTVQLLWALSFFRLTTTALHLKNTYTSLALLTSPLQRKRNLTCMVGIVVQDMCKQPCFRYRSKKGRFDG